MVRCDNHRHHTDFQVIASCMFNYSIIIVVCVYVVVFVESCISMPLSSRTEYQFCATRRHCHSVRLFLYLALAVALQLCSLI